MPTVKLTNNLCRFFPQLQDRLIRVPAGSVAEVLNAVNEIAPGFSDYVLDEHGALRRHVTLCINEDAVIDREKLSDRVPEEATVFVFQALTGG